MTSSYTPTENLEHPEFLPTVDMNSLVTSYQSWSESVAWANEVHKTSRAEILEKVSREPDWWDGICGANSLEPSVHTKERWTFNSDSKPFNHVDCLDIQIIEEPHKIYVYPLMGNLAFDLNTDTSKWLDITEYLMSVVCGECVEYRPDDARVQGGMKCGNCAYG